MYSQNNNLQVRKDLKCMLWIADDQGGIYLLHLRAPGQLWMRFWMVGCEKPKKSAPDGTMGTTDLELRERNNERLNQGIKKNFFGICIRYLMDIF